MKKLIDKSGRFLRWFVFNRKKMFQRTRQIIFVARFISRYTKTNADDIALAKLDKILKEFISEYLGGMEKQEAIELAKKITGVKRGPLKAINVSLDTNKSKLGFTIKI